MNSFVLELSKIQQSLKAQQSDLEKLRSENQRLK